MALGVNARMTVQEGKNSEFKSLFLAPTDKVLANE